MSEETAERAVEREQAFMAAATDAMDAMVAMALVDEDGSLVHVSRRWCELTGWARDEVVGHHWKMVVHPDDVADTLEVGRQAIERGEVLRMESRICSRDGDIAWIQSEVTPLREPDGRVRRWMMVASDISASKEATEALRRSERKLQVILDHSTDVISILEPSGRWRSTEASGARKIEVPMEAFMDHPESVVLPEDLPDLARSVRSLIDNGPHQPPATFEFRVMTSDGATRWIETTGVNLAGDPAVDGLVLHSRDVTEQRLAADEMRSMVTRLETLLAHLMDGVVMADERGTVLFANRAASELLGLGTDPSVLVDRSPGSLRGDLRRLYDDYEGALARINELMAARQPVHGERVQFTDGRVCSRSFIPIFDGDAEYRGHVWLFRDLGEELAMASERDRLLEMEKAQNTRLLELDALKTDLVASVSHELRTPLTSIVSFTHLLREGLETDTSDEQREFIDIIARNSGRLLRLVDDLLLLDRLESNTMQFQIEPVDLVSLVEMSVTSLSPMADSRGVALSLASEDGEPVVSDVDRLGQLVDNLVANAIKFTNPGGSVDVLVTPGPGHTWRLVVSDNGIGIPDDEVDQLFQRFFRASNARREASSGSGLGLAIARRLVELHGGAIDVASEEGKGTTVTVVLGDLIVTSVGSTTESGPWEPA